jgi:hypothetical protein
MLLKEEKEKLFAAGEEENLVGVSGRDSGKSSWHLLMIFKSVSLRACALMIGST